MNLTQYDNRKITLVQNELCLKTFIITSLILTNYAYLFYDISALFKTFKTVKNCLKLFSDYCTKLKIDIKT